MWPGNRHLLVLSLDLDRALGSWAGQWLRQGTATFPKVLRPVCKGRIGNCHPIYNTDTKGHKKKKCSHRTTHTCAYTVLLEQSAASNLVGGLEGHQDSHFP